MSRRLSPIYNVIVTQVRVGTNDLDSKFTALFDFGTSFTYLVDPLYTMLSDSFNSYIREKRLPPDPRLPFEYCYIMRKAFQQIEERRDQAYLFTSTLTERHKKAIYEALEKVKAELMVLGFISLILVFSQYFIADICIPINVTDTMLTCPAGYQCRDLEGSSNW